MKMDNCEGSCPEGLGILIKNIINIQVLTFYLELRIKKSGAQ